MNITSAEYRAIDGTNVCIRAMIDGEEIFAPLDPDNRHYQAILEWVAEGNEIQAAE